MPAIHVRRLSPNEANIEVTLRATIDAMGDAFKGDVFTEMTAGNADASVQSPLVRDLHAAQIRAGLIGGLVYVAEVEGRGVAGAAVWFGPGQDLLSSPEQAEVGFNDFMKDLGTQHPELPGWWMTKFLPFYTAFTSESLQDPQLKHNAWQLQLIGVRRDCQRLGVGHALVHAVENLAKATQSQSGGLPATTMTVETETDAALQFYQSLGFVVRGETTIHGDDSLNPAVSCPMWCLSKDCAE